MYQWSDKRYIDDTIVSRVLRLSTELSNWLWETSTHVAWNRARRAIELCSIETGTRVLLSSVLAAHNWI